MILVRVRKGTEIEKALGKNKQKGGGLGFGLRLELG